MKKLIAALLAVGTTTLVTTQAFAQGAPSSSMATSYKVKRSSGLAIMPAITLGGTQFTTLSQFGNQGKAETGLSYTVGALAELGRGTFVFQTGLLYTQQSASANVDQTTFSNGGGGGGGMSRINKTTELSASYLGVPLAFKARTRVAEGIRLVGRAGVMPAFFLSKRLKETGTFQMGGMNEVQINSTDSSKDGIRNFNVFAMIGAGPEFAIARNQNLRVELGYERMLMSIAEKTDINPSSTALHSLNLMLSYAVGI